MKHKLFSARRLLVAATALMVILPLHARAASDWPSRVVKLVVPFPAGSVTDRIGRVLAQGLEKSIGQTVVVENRPGAGATIGSDYVSRANPDGYTILLGANASHAVNVSFMNLNYDPIKSFEPISLVAAVPSALMVRPGVPANSVAELLALAKKDPGKLTYTSAGIGTTGHLGMEMLASMTDVELLHVPAKGPGQALQDVMAGHVDMLIESVALSSPLINDGRLRGLAVTSTTPSPAQPKLPPLAEAGVPGYELLLWFGLYAPAGTPQAIVDTLHAETVRIFADPAVRDPLTRDGVTLVTSTPEELTKFQKSEIEKFGKLIKSLNLDLRR